MKARDHDKIMRQQTAAFKAMKQRHEAFYKGEIADRERIMDNYANALDRLDAEISILTQMLVDHGVDREVIDRHVAIELTNRLYGEIAPDAQDFYNEADYTAALAAQAA